LLFLRRNLGISPITLFLDQYPAYTSPLSRARAKELNIRMIFVSKGATAVYQPFDRRIYWVMKSKPVTKESAANLASEYWIELTRESIISAWAIEGIESEDGRDALGSENDDIVSEGRSSSIECDIEYEHDDIDIEDIMAVEEVVSHNNEDHSE
jgi:hypothetical protein